MNYYIAVFSSITLANKLKKYFQYDGSFMALMHAPTSIPMNGCAYCLRFREEKLNDVMEAANRFDIPIKAIYREMPNHAYQEYRIS